MLFSWQRLATTTQESACMSMLFTTQPIISAKLEPHSFRSSQVIVCLVCHCFHLVLDSTTETILLDQGGGLNSDTVETCKEWYTS